MGRMPVRTLLGEILVTDYRVPVEHVEEAVRAGRGTGRRLGQVLVRMGVLSERDLVTALAQQLAVPVVLELPTLEIPETVLALVPIVMAERKLVIPVEVCGSRSNPFLVLAMADPTDDACIRGMEGLVGFQVLPAIAPEEDVRRALKVFYFKDPRHRRPQEVTDALEGMRVRMHELSVSGVNFSGLNPIPIAPYEEGSTGV